MTRQKTSEFILILSEKCDCRNVAKPLKGLFAQDCVMVHHRFDGAEQYLLLDLPVEDEVTMRNRIRNFRKKYPDCKLFDKSDFDKLSGRGKFKAWLVGSTPTQLIKIGFDIWSKLQMFSGSGHT